MLNHVHGKCLGRMAARPADQRRNLRMAEYVVRRALPPRPTKTNWLAKLTGPLGVMANDRLGDCTCAAAGHAVQVWTANASQEVTVADADVISMYSAVSGYDPATGANDNGAVEVDALNYFRNTGVGGHKIDAYVAIDPKSQIELEYGCWLFGGVYLGVSLPLISQRQKIWDVPPHIPFLDRRLYKAGSWGGHAIFAPDFDHAAGLTGITWGDEQAITWNWLAEYADEAYALVSREFIAATMQAPNGFDISALMADLAALPSAKAA